MDEPKLFAMAYDDLKYRCTNMDGKPDFNFGINPCGNSIRYNGIWLCGNKNGQYAPDYCSERCGAAVRRTE